MATCGNCHQYHEHVADIRACYAAGGTTTITRTNTRVTRSYPASEKQIKFLTSLLADRAHGWNAEQVLPGLSSDKKAASAAIDWLLRQPKKVGAPATSTVVANTAPTSDVRDGTYTVVLDGDDYVTLQIKAEKWCDGKRVVSFLSGPDNELSYTGFAFLSNRGLNVWKKFKDNTRIVAAAQFLLTGNVDEAHKRFLDLAEAYALSSNHCMACGRKLTVPVSVHRGIGPVCYGREGW